MAMIKNSEFSSLLIYILMVTLTYLNHSSKMSQWLQTELKFLNYGFTCDLNYSISSYM